jgi:hypothetical protein
MVSPPLTAPVTAVSAGFSSRILLMPSAITVTAILLELRLKYH